MPDSFDPVAATEALLATVPPDVAARSDAYFEGGYWLLLWSALWSIAAASLLLYSGAAVRMRALAERLTKRPSLVALIFGALAIVAITLLELPWAIYAEFVREHEYGLATQGFGEWIAEQGIALGVNVVMFAPVIAALYALIRRAGRAWWAWTGAASVGLLAFGLMIGPVVVEPLFNEYAPLEAGPLRDDILALARANGVPSENVFVVDASRQTTRISANVSGLLGTARIALNDNLLRECTPAEIRAVMAHEMGHYAMGHAFALVLQMSLVFAIGAFLADRAFALLLRRHGARWSIRELSDPASLLVLYAVVSAYFLLATPVINNIFRVGEANADLFALNAAREPDAQASVLLKLATYRKLAPGPIEEMLMYDHPSARSRILMAMRWKAEQHERADSAREP